MREVFESLLKCMEQGHHSVLVSAVGGEGSAPRKEKSHMLVTAQGRVCGTVGGGAVEGKSIELAMQMLKDGKTCMLKCFELHEKAPDGIGMICGGRVEILFSCVSSHDLRVKDMASLAISQYEKGENTWLLMNMRTGRMTLLCENGMSEEEKHEISLAGLWVGDAGRIAHCAEEHYAEKIVSDEKVWIFGGGHVAQALVPVLSSVGFRCMVIEDRGEFCDSRLFPGACAVRHIPASEWSSISISAQDYVCIMTRGHAYDLDCQAIALRTPACYIGVIGSRRKKDSVNARLRSMGFSEEELARIHTPIGLEIGAITPAEIAVSITAEMIARRAGRRKESVSKICMG